MTELLRKEKVRVKLNSQSTLLYFCIQWNQIVQDKYNELNKIQDEAGEAKPNIPLIIDGEAGAYCTPATPVQESYLF